MFTLPEIKLNNSWVSSIFYILFSKHYILNRETSMINPSGYEPHTLSSILNWLETNRHRFSLEISSPTTVNL